MGYYLPMSSRHLVIGTRGSALALKQTDIAIEAIRAADPSVSTEVRVIKTHGDVDQNPIPLDTIGKGWFTQEIESALLEGSIHLAVHSLKDMADEMPGELHIGAYLAREDARDALITKNGMPLEDLPEGAVIGTDSARRQVQMSALRPGVRMQSLRGNVLTRLDKLQSEPYDAIILAAAGLKRLGLEGKITRYFEPEEMVPAPGQGILAVQAHTIDAELHALLARITNADAALAARVERSFSHAIGGGCKAPTGAYAKRLGSECVLVGMVADKDGTIVSETMRMPWDDCEALGVSLAQKLLAKRA